MTAARRALVIHSERHIARLTQVNLQRSGFDVSVAQDRERAWQEITARPPDLILLEIASQAGFGLLREIKSDKRTRDIPVMILSSSRDPEVLRKWTETLRNHPWFKRDSDDENPQ